MYRKFITTIAAASVALTALGAVPAFADNDRDLARALAAILGVAVVGSIIHDTNKKKRVHHSQHHYQPQYTPPRPRQDLYQPRPRQGHIQPQPRSNVQPHIQPRPLPRTVRRNLLPQQCLRSFDTRQGKVRMFPRSCLERHYSHLDRLPQNCATRIKTGQGRRIGWEAHCLRQEGYRLARR